MIAAERPRPTAGRVAMLFAIGVGTGYLSGLFGIGGGIVLVPLLVAVGYQIKDAGAISLAAVFVISLVGVTSYALLGEVDWAVAVLVAIGSVTGAQIGTRVVDRIPARAIQLAFAIVLVLVAASLFWVVPDRDAGVAVTLLAGAGLVATGLAIGFLSSLLGLGGAFLVVPAMMLIFGASDLLAKATALAMMVPTTLSGSIGNHRAGRLDLRASAFVAAGAVLTTSLGAVTATVIDPLLGNVLFAALLLAMAAQLAWRARPRARAA